MSDISARKATRQMPFFDVETAPKDGTTIEVKHGMHQQTVRAVWSGPDDAFIRKNDSYRWTLHRVTAWRPVARQK